MTLNLKSRRGKHNAIKEQLALVEEQREDEEAIDYLCAEDLDDAYGTNYYLDPVPLTVPFLDGIRMSWRGEA